MPEYQIDHYDLKQGWSRIPDPGTTDLKTAGYEFYAHAGIEGGFEITVYSAPERRYLIFVDNRDSSVETIMASDLPSMIELVHKLTPMALAAQLQAVQDFAMDLKELLTKYGPLREAYEAQWDCQKAETERPRQKSGRK